METYKNIIELEKHISGLLCESSKIAKKDRIVIFTNDVNEGNSTIANCFDRKSLLQSMKEVVRLSDDLVIYDLDQLNALIDSSGYENITKHDLLYQTNISNKLSIHSKAALFYNLSGQPVYTLSFFKSKNELINIIPKNSDNPQLRKIIESVSMLDKNKTNEPFLDENIQTRTESKINSRKRKISPSRTSTSKQSLTPSKKTGTSDKISSSNKQSNDSSDPIDFSESDISDFSETFHKAIRLFIRKPNKQILADLNENELLGFQQYSNAYRIRLIVPVLEKLKLVNTKNEISKDGYCQLLKSIGLCYTKVPGDGSCGFHSLIKCLTALDINEEIDDVKTLRTVLADMLEYTSANRLYYTKWATANHLIHSNLKEFVKRLRKSEWMDELILQVASDYFKVKICVLSLSSFQAINIFEPAERSIEQPFIFLLLENYNHFSPLVQCS